MSSTAGPDYPANPARIVIIDDHPLFRSALGAVVERCSDLEVVAEGADGQEALELCHRFRPDLVLMDVRLPGMDGLEATRAIKRDLPRTIVLMVTASEDPDHLAQAIKVGAAGYVLKFSSPQQITDAIRRALEGESPLNQALSKALILRLLDESQKPQEQSPDVSQEVPPSGEKEHLEPSLFQGLSPRELEVLSLLVQGKTNQQIAASLLVSVSTVKKHIHQVISTLGVSDRTQAVVLALKAGLDSMEDE